VRAEPWIVVLARDPRDSKSRLAPALGGLERRELAAAMRDDVLDAALEVTPRVLLVTEAGDATRRGVEILRTPAHGTNQAARAALRELARRGSDAALVLAADLPLASAGDIAAVIEAGRAADVVIVPDRHERGTNALYLAPPEAIASEFGPDSFALHVRAAGASGRVWRVLRPPGIVADVDVPDDLEYARAASLPAGRRSAALLLQGQVSRPSR
jgi:2-phospho-L-lactate guanylyltransferase